MPFSHNDCYHPLLLRAVPAGARRALDVGCGTGLFARRLAARGLDVDAIDVDERVVEVARAVGSPGPGRIHHRLQDVTAAPPEPGTYDVVSCIAALHHVPFRTVEALRDALRPGGVLLVLGLARPRSPRDLALWGAAAPVLNLPARAAVALGERLNGGPDHGVRPVVRDWTTTMTDVRRGAAALLPGSTVRPLVFWRYLLTYRDATATF